MKQSERLSDEKLQAEVAKLIAEVAQIGTQTHRVTISTILMPFLAAAALMGATAAVVKLFF
jgi:poly-beta-hydroxyalkanoate depolymerase